MIINNKISFLAIGLFSLAFSNTVLSQDTIVKPVIKLSYLDSIKATFVSDDLASCIDSRWSTELTSLNTYDEMLSDIANIDPDVKVDYELPTELLKERLKIMDEKSPFNIEYNVGLENVIKSFLKNRRRSFERLMGISQFYFPIFEEELAKKNIPLEIKYLAVVESALNPRAVSRVGATGLWQFMYQTGKQYGLNISSYTDERSDPLKSSEAASQYMTNMYRIFGDWDLVLAAYNSGPGNVSKAIRRSGGQQNYWNIRKNLPKETQGYLPAFLATMYIFEYHKEHGIVPNKAIANHFATDTIMVKRHMTFKQISDLLDISSDEIAFFNPSYKRSEVPFISGQPNFLRLPKNKIAVFTSNETQIYAYIDYQDGKRERPNDAIAYKTKSKKPEITEQINTEQISSKSELENVAANKEFTLEKVVVTKEVSKYHKVRKGDNLSSIADKYKVSAADIKKWNKLKSTNIMAGANLKVITNQKVVTLVKKEVKSKGNAQKEIIAVAETGVQPKSTSIAAVAEATKQKATLNTKTEVVTAEITKDDPRVAINGVYTVVKSDNLLGIAKEFNTTVSNIKEWNNLESEAIAIGDKIVVVDKKVSSEATSKLKYHVVEKGEFLGQVARKYNVTVNEILELNNLSSTTVQAGAKLIVGIETIEMVAKTLLIEKSAAIKNKKPEKLYQVKKGDSLFSISQKFVVPVADLKKWNDIKDEKIQPGMKLKING